LSAWLGAAAFFAAIVAPAAFAALPSRELAAAVVGRALPPLFLTGLGLGLGVGSLALWGPRRRLRTSRAIAASVIAIACAVAQLGVAPRIATLRATMTQPLTALAPDHPQRLAFGRLHMLSVASLGVAAVAAATMVVMTLSAPRSRRATGALASNFQ